MNIRPLNNWAVIRPDTQEEKTAGGIFIPDAAKEKTQLGKVMSIGPGRMKAERDKKGKVIDKKFEPTVVKPGDHVLYDKYVGNQIEAEDESVLLVREDNILGIFVP